MKKFILSFPLVLFLSSYLIAAAPASSEFLKGYGVQKVRIGNGNTADDFSVLICSYPALNLYQTYYGTTSPLNMDYHVDTIIVNTSTYSILVSTWSRNPGDNYLEISSGSATISPPFTTYNHTPLWLSVFPGVSTITVRGRIEKE